jgi:hypothetical protein
MLAYIYVQDALLIILKVLRFYGIHCTSGHH